MGRDIKTCERAVHAADYLISLGILSSTRRGDAALALTELLKGDFIPKVKLAKGVRNLRPAAAGMRCAQGIGNDFQSGPYYCGDPADIMGDLDGARVAVCRHHEGCIKECL